MTQPDKVVYRKKKRIVQNPAKSAATPILSVTVVRAAVVTKKPPVAMVEPKKVIPEKKAKPAPVKQAKKRPLPPPKPPLTPTIPRFVKVCATLTRLRQEFPLVFTEDDILPFAVGLRQEAYKVLKERAKAEGRTLTKAEVSKSLISDAIVLYKQLHPEYQEKLLIEGTPRRGIDGEIKGMVTAEHVARATSTIPD